MKVKKVVLQFLCSVLFGCFLTLPVLEDEASTAEENKNIQGTLMMTAAETQGRKQPSDNAEVMAELPPGTHVLVTGPKEDGWYEVYYQGEKVFVPAGALTSPALDAEALDKEMKKAEEEDIAFIESLEIQRKAIARSKIWSLLISVLILAMFITGIVSAWKKGKNAKAGNGER